MAKQQCVSKVSAKKPVQDKIDQKKENKIALKIIAVLRFDTKAKAYFLFFSIKTFSEPLDDRCVTIYCFESLSSSP